MTFPPTTYPGEAGTFTYVPTAPDIEAACSLEVEAVLLEDEVVVVEETGTGGFRSDISRPVPQPVNTTNGSNAKKTCANPIAYFTLKEYPLNVLFCTVYATLRV
jgi:hypothetical protein